MPRRIPSLGLLRAFERAAYHRSFKLAAEELHVTPSAVSHKIKQLEEELGIPLFQRITRAVRLTPAGQLYFKDVHRAFARLETGTQQLHDRYGQQVLRLHVLPFFATEMLIPRLHSFQDRHPDIDLHLESAFGRGEIHPPEADISIGLGQGNRPGLVAEPLMPLELQAMCSPKVAEQIDPNNLEDINNQGVIYFASKLDAWEQWARAVGLKEFKPRATLTVDSMFSGLQAAEQGLGLVTAVLPITQEWINRSTLVPPFPNRVQIPDRYYLIYRKGDDVRSNVKLFRDWALEEFAEQ